MVDRRAFRLSVPARVSFVYALAGLAWIFASDWLLFALDLRENLEQQLQNVKGIAFVAVTALIMYGLLALTFRQTDMARAETGRLSALLERSMGSASSAIFNWNASDNRIEMSPGLKRMAGLDRRGLIHPMTVWRAIRKTDRDHLFQQLADPESDEFSAVLMIGNENAGGMWLQIDGLIRRDEAGRAIHVAGSATDVSAIKLSEEKLMATREELQQSEAEKLDAERRLRKALRGVINALTRAIEARDPYTAGHQMRVAHLSARIAQKLSLSDIMVEHIILGAMIHDIGKIRVPVDLLTRPGKISDDELAIIRAHTAYGDEILSDSGVPGAVRDIVRHHHERLDGSGYPDGLAGDDISLPVRIVAVADVVEAITAFRPYRQALGIDVALRELKAGRGQSYDADAVDACLTLFSKEKYAFPEHQSAELLGLRVTPEDMPSLAPTESH